MKGGNVGGRDAESRRETEAKEGETEGGRAERGPAGDTRNDALVHAGLNEVTEFGCVSLQSVTAARAQANRAGGPAGPRVAQRARGAEPRRGSGSQPPAAPAPPRPAPLASPPAGRARHCGSCGPRGSAERSAASASAGHLLASGSGSDDVGRAAAGRWLSDAGRGRPRVRALGRQRRPGPSSHPRRPRAGRR